MLSSIFLTPDKLHCGFARYKIITNDKQEPIDFEFIEVNSEFERLTSLKKDEIIGHTIRSILPDIEQDSFDWINEYGKVALSGEQKDFEQYSSSLNKWYKIYAVSDEQDYFSTFFFDITEFKTRVLDLETFFEVSKDLLCILDQKGNILELNNAWEKQFQYSHDEVKGKWFFDLIENPLGNSISNDILTMSSKEDINITNSMKDANGTWHEIEWHFKTSNNKIYATGHNISSQQKKESAHESSEQLVQRTLDESQLFKKLVELSGDCFYILDLDNNGRMMYVNKAAQIHFGADLSVIYNWHITDFDPNYTLDKIPALVKAIKKQKKLQLKTVHKNVMGEIIPVEITVNYHRDRKGRDLAYGWFSDISEKLNIQEKLKDSSYASDKANQAKSEFLANMSHEIRTPLNGVIGFADLMRKTPLSAIQQNYINNITISSHSLLDLINDILDFSKIEAEKLELESEKENIGQLIEKSIDIIRYAAEKKQLELILTIDPDLPAFVWIDGLRLRQVITNLLSNAVKFTSEGQVELEIRYKKETDRKGTLFFAVHDTGIGINDEQKKRLFKAFSQADNTISKKYGGTGLGLAISKLLVKKMGGELEVKSEPGIGSTFHFSLTTKVSYNQEVLDHDFKSISNCLVIDENPKNQQNITNILTKWDIHCTSSYDGFGATAIINETYVPDLILISQHNKQINGLETVELLIKEHEKQLLHTHLIIMHSSSEEVTFYERCESINIKYRITKPVKESELYHCLQSIMKPGSDVITNLKTSVEKKKAVKESKILIAEDDEINMMMIKAQLRSLFPDILISEASTGLEALEIYKNEPLDLILMDVQMPEMNGLKATEEIRKLETKSSKHIPIIALTAGAFKEEKKKTVDAGMDIFLSKPVDSEILNTTIKNVIKDIVF